MSKKLRFCASVLLTASLLTSFAACSKDDKKSKETEATEVESETTETTIPTVVETSATTTIPQFSGPLPTDSVVVSWSETQVDSKVMYAYVTNDFLRIRSGPGTDYDIVGSLTADMEVVVVAITENDWYKTSDGFYVSSQFLRETPSSPKS